MSDRVNEREETEREEQRDKVEYDHQVGNTVKTRNGYILKNKKLF